MRRPSQGSRASALSLLLAFAFALAFPFGCATSQIDSSYLPSLEALQSVQPGVTTRSEVLHRLGPPEEMRRPANFDRARMTTPQHRRVLEEGRVFGDDAYTYVSGRRKTTDLGIMPAGPKLLHFSWTGSQEDRWRIEFDANDVVLSISHTDEFAEAR